MNTVFIYALCEPGTRTVRYIGYSNNPKKRLRTHKCRSTPAGSWLRGLTEKPNLVILSEVPAESRKSEEVRYITNARMLGMNLLNVNEGGGGVVTHTPEARAKIGEASRGSRNPNFGVSPSVETRGKMRLARIGQHLSEETKSKISVKISALKKGVKLPSEHCANIGRSKLGMLHSEDTKSRMSRAQEERWRRMSEEDYERLCKKSRERKDSAETKKKKSLAAIAREERKRAKRLEAVPPSTESPGGVA